MKELIIIGIALVVMGATVPGPGSAQGRRHADASQQVGCFRGRPLPACKSFWIVEMQGSEPIAQTSRTVREVYSVFDAQRNASVGVYENQRTAFAPVLEWTLGHMANLGEKYALGGVVTGGTGNGGSGLTGLKVRLRRWLSSDFSLEAEAGAFWGNAQTVRRSTGGTAALRFNIRDQGAVYLRWDVLPLPGESRSGEYGYHDPGGTQHGLSVGVGLGSLPALIGTGALGVAMAVLFAMYVGQFS